jgi:hypothetical protein
MHSLGIPLIPALKQGSRLTLEVYSLNAIGSHFAQSLITWEKLDLMVMISLSRVSVVFFLCILLICFLENDFNGILSCPVLLSDIEV